MKRTPLGDWLEAKGHGGLTELARRVGGVSKQGIYQMMIVRRPVAVVEDGAKIWLEEPRPPVRYYGKNAPKAPKHNVTK